MTTAERILAAYGKLGDLTPLKTDCGRLCNGACCGTDEDGQGGVHLFPGEEAYASDMSWGSIVKDDFAPMLVCHGMCDRDKRPFACRIFPLTPCRNAEGKWTVRLDARARSMCPLSRGGLKGLDGDFARAVRDAIRILSEDETLDAFLDGWQQLESEYRFKL